MSALLSATDLAELTGSPRPQRQKLALHRAGIRFVERLEAVNAVLCGKVEAAESTPKLDWING